MIRNHITDKEEAGFIHSAKFPFLKEENWYIIIGDEDKNEVKYMKLVKNYKKVVVEKF